jgi:signal transduction histidine kinase/FixJ family two-component response regulator
MNTATLREFMVSVPTCVETDSLMAVWRLFQAGWERIVVVNAKHVPMGALSLPQFIVFLAKQPESGLPFLPGSRPRVDGFDAGLEVPHIYRRLEAPMQAIASQYEVSAVVAELEPLIPLPVDWEIDHFHASLQASPLPDAAASTTASQAVPLKQWVLISADGQYVGLLDQLRLLQVLATRTVPPPRPNYPDRSPALAAIAQERQTPTPVIDPLIDLLERIPVPLMLQTGAGRIITQNLAWRQQVSGLRDPGQIGREAAAILESTEWEMPISGEPTPEAQSMVSPSPTVPNTTHRSTVHYTSSCRMSAEPNGCVCLCPMKSGQDRVWKFLKIPMGITSSQLGFEPNLSLVNSASERATHSSHPPPFKLATFGFSPDPAWRSLAQTEYLWLVLAQDITEQHQIARELAAKNADLMQLNRLKDEFLACISHELKTPLTAVLGLSSLLKNQMLGELNERQSRYAHLIYQSGRHLILIVNDILDLTRIETGQLELSLESVQIEKVCLAAYDQAQQLHEAEQPDDGANEVLPPMNFSLTLQPGLEHLIADELRLRQMLCNLLSNALKFTEPGGAIGLNIEAWEGWIAFNVWDTGIGIPADKQHLIFQKFQQLENPLTRQFEGTGLGLVLTQRLARLHGGDVTFTSVEGEGSQFTLLLPPCPPQATEAFTQVRAVTSESAVAVTANNRLMMLVESDTELIEGLSHQLVHLGYRVAIARSGTEALEKIRRLQPGIVFLNPILPLLSGWDVLTLLKADEETRHIPVVVTATRVDKERAFQNGANGFLSMPIQAEGLRRCLERLLEPTPTPSVTHTSSRLTVLYLHSVVTPDGAASPSAASSHPSVFANPQDLHNLLHAHHCRVLEVDDLEQANLLCQVWKPNVILLDGGFDDPSEYLKQLSLYPGLAALPLVTLTADMTYAANLIPGLTVFPCLSLSQSSQTPNSTRQDSSALWQAIQMASGIHWTPHILVADIATLEADWAVSVPSDLHQHVSSTEARRSPSVLQALVQYMQIAGFRSSMGHSWQEVAQQLEHHSVDLLLLCAPASRQMHPLFLEMFHTLEGLATKPAILVWNCHTESIAPSPEEIQNFVERWSTIATEVLPTPLSMPELLNRINLTLASR